MQRKMNEATQRGGRSQWRQWSRSSLWTILILTSMATCHSSPVYLKNSHHLSHYQSGRNIRHLPCKIRRSGEEGICMFAIDCLKSNGTHLGTCIDRFYFGSCCHIKDDQLLVEPEISDNSIDENTISHFLHQQTRPTGGTLKPSTEGETPERTERPLIPVSTISATTSHNLSSESSVPALHHHYTTNYDVISLSSSSPSPPSSSSATTTPSPVPSSLATEPSTSSAPLEETRFTSSTPAATTTPENVKLSTFQSVEDVTKAPVEEVTTPRVTTTTHSTRYPTRRTTTQQPTTTSTTVKSTHSPKPKPKPTNVKRPSSTKKPPASPSSRPKPTRRPTTPVANATTITKKPTRKPTTESTTLAAIIPTRKKTTTTTPSTTTLPTTLSTTTTESTTKKVITTTTVQTTAKPTTVTTVKSTPGTDEEEKPLTTLSFVETTKAPRPKPKPTSSIAIVPPSTIAVEEVEIQSSTSGVESPVTQSEVLSTSTSTSTLTSTSAAAVENATKAETTTMASGLVTWTNNIDESERNKTESTTEGWIPLQTIPVESSSEATPAAITEAINATTAEDTTASSTTGVTIGNATEQTSAQTTAGDVAQNGTTETTTPMMEGIDYRLICGKRMFPEPRIVGGTKAAFGRWPWQISLRQWRTSTYLHKCGAALLNENWAITAAHCVDNVPPSDLLLRLGEYDLAEEEEPYGYQERRVQIVASHPQFNPHNFEYDLALLRFYEPVIFQPNIIPVCVPDSDESFIGRTAYVTGWGRLYEDGPLPSVLQEVTVPVIENTICEAMYKRAGFSEKIPHIFICAGWKNGGFDSCEGDSGGPMVIQRHDKRFQLAGVISWGIGCAEPNQPGVYTRISEFRDWINQILQF